jgi:hypothetical protein
MAADERLDDDDLDAPPRLILPDYDCGIDLTTLNPEDLRGDGSELSFDDEPSPYLERILEDEEDDDDTLLLTVAGLEPERAKPLVPSWVLLVALLAAIALFALWNR